MTTTQSETCIVDKTQSYSIDDFESGWYIGKIIDKDSYDENFHIHQISFQEKRKKIFMQWPVNKNMLWCRDTEIAFLIRTTFSIWKIYLKEKLKTGD